MKIKSNISIFKPAFQRTIRATGYGSFGSLALDFPEDKIEI